VWVDRQGHEESIKGVPRRPFMYARLSPDGTRAALDIRDQENDIWVWDFTRQTLTRVSTSPGSDETPAWMPDGRRIVFASQSGGGEAILLQSADGSGVAERLTETTNAVRVSAVSKEGTRVLYSHARGATATDVMMLTLEKGQQPQPLIQTAFAEQNAEISPNGRWVAYESNVSGQFQVYVLPFPDVSKERSQVSTDGGIQPHWAPSGQELFYLGPNGALMSVRVESGPTWKAGTPTQLFEGRYYRGRGSSISRTYDVSPDGKRFLMIKEGDGSSQSTVTTNLVVVRNWLEEVKRLVPIKR